MRVPDTWSAGGTPINMPQLKTPEKIEERREGDRVFRDGQNGHGQDRRERLGRRGQHHYRRPAPEGEPVQEAFFPAPVLCGLGISTVAGALLGLLVGVLLFNAGIVIPGWEVLFATRDITFHLLWVMIGSSAGVLVGAAVVMLAAPDHI